MAIFEPNRYHQETVLAFVSALAGVRCLVFGPDNWSAHEFARDLGASVSWDTTPSFDATLTSRQALQLIVVNTFPSPGGQALVERALDLGYRVLGLVHDPDFFPDGARDALRRWPHLYLAHAGAVAPSRAAELERGELARVERFLPVVRAPIDDAPRTGVALSGSIEFGRREMALALQLAAASGARLRIFGRSREHGDPAQIPRDLDADRARLFDEIAKLGIDDLVTVTTDLSCRSFYAMMRSCEFAAVMPARPEYFRGKLTGTLTAAISCGTPLLATNAVVQAHHAAGPDFLACMVPFDPHAPPGHADDLSSRLAAARVAQDDLRQATRRVRDMVLGSNGSYLASMIAS